MASAPLYSIRKERFWIKESVEKRLTRSISSGSHVKRYFRQWREVYSNGSSTDANVKKLKWVVTPVKSIDEVHDRFLEFATFFQKEEVSHSAVLTISLSKIAPLERENYCLGFTGFIQSFFLERQSSMLNVVFLYEEDADYAIDFDENSYGIYKVYDGKVWECLFVSEDGDSIRRESAIEYKNDKGYVVTGASGSVGLHFIEFLLNKGVQHLYLLGRRPVGSLSKEHLELMKSYQSLGRNIQYFESETDIDSIFKSIDKPIDGIIHLAGAYSNLHANAFTPEEISKVLRPKVDLSMQLFQKAREYKVSFFMVASSAVTMTGAPSLSHYAFANGWMDGLSEGHTDTKVYSIAWGGWKGSNMVRAGSNESFQSEWGFTSALPEHMMKTLDSVRVGYQAVVDINWDRYFKMAPQMRQFRPLRGFDKGNRSLDEQAGAKRGSINLEVLLREILGEILQDVPERIDFRKPFEEIGFNSLMAIELSNKINHALGLSLPSTVIYAYPTPDQLLQTLQSEYRQEQEGVGQIINPSNEEEDFLELQKLLEEKLKSSKS
jgi:acyl carrier protein